MRLETRRKQDTADKESKEAENSHTARESGAKTLNIHARPHTVNFVKSVEQMRMKLHRRPTVLEQLEVIGK